ncbi:uncharacterized protein [Pyrus communis]|uniref:uncharacterized protein n=1 Tax=Pyrus communis TaxID=23211 RepID=UPI0035C12550
MDIKEDNKEELWFLDSGCINHMCGKKELFIDLDDTFRKSVKLGNNSSLDVIGMRNIRMEVNGIMQVITGVFYVPDLKNNLLSIGQLQEKGLAIFIKSGKCRIYHPERGQIWETTMAENHMFILQLTAAYTPQQNGVVERKNRTIMNMVRSMLTEKKIPRTFWPETENKAWDWSDHHQETIMADLEWDMNEEGDPRNDEADEPTLESKESDHNDQTEMTAIEGRVRRQPVWMRDYVSGEVTNGRNNTWELIEMPPEGKIVWVKWIYQTKFNEKGEVDKYKAHLVTKGYSQQYGVDYAEVFAPVAQLDIVRVILSLAARNDWTAPQAWYSRIESYFMKEGFEKCPHEHTLFVKRGGKMLIVCLYVDDLIFTGNDESMFKDFKHSMMTEFDMTDLGRMSYFLGLEVIQRSEGIYVSQRKYAQEVLERFNMDQCNAVHNPIVPGFKLMKDEEGVEVDNTLYK